MSRSFPWQTAWCTQKWHDMGLSGAFSCHYLPPIFCRGFIHHFFFQWHRPVFHTLICLVWSPRRVISVGYSLINTEWESGINASQCICGVPKVFREVLRRFRDQDNNCPRHRRLEAHTCLGFPSCQVSCSTLESLLLEEREILVSVYKCFRLLFWVLLSENIGWKQNLK